MCYLQCLYLLVVFLPQFESKEVNINTTLGPIFGISEEVEFMGAIKHVTRFLGLPYALPPIGDRRFKRPEPSGNYIQSYNATYFRPHCMQSETVNPSIKFFGISENCLHLNIYTPGSTVSSEKKYAVMIFIHGGGFTYGGAEVFSGDKLSSFHDVVVVTINYRLNTFGFLSNGTTSSGNMGLWDQKLAIQWVHDNIADFAGDPTNVTLFGNSAGGASVLYQALNPTNRGLFQRVLAESGSVLAQWAQQYNSAETFSAFVATMNCSLGLYSDILQCLQSTPAEDLITNNFGPVVDRDFIKEDPSVTFSDEKMDISSPLSLLTEIDLLSGVTSKDGVGVVEKLDSSFKALGVDISKGVPRNIFETQFIPGMLQQMYGREMPDALVKSIIYQYIDWSHPNDPETIRDKMVDFSSDATFFVPAMDVVKKHQKLREPSRRTYFYVFNHKPPFDSTPLWLNGAKHTMELPYVFGFPDAMKVAVGIPVNTPLMLPPDDLKLSSAMMKMWTNFAKTGDPNLPAQTDGQGILIWPPYDIKTQSYLEFSSNMTSQSVKSHFAEPRVEFWTNVVPLLESCGTCENRNQNQNCTEGEGDHQTSSANSFKIHTSAYMYIFLCFCALTILKTF